MIVLAALFCLLFTTGGVALSYGPELPAGATVIELAGAAYLVTIVGKFFCGAGKRQCLRGGLVMERDYPALFSTVSLIHIR